MGLASLVISGVWTQSWETGGCTLWMVTGPIIHCKYAHLCFQSLIPLLHFPYLLIGMTKKFFGLLPQLLELGHMMTTQGGGGSMCLLLLKLFSWTPLYQRLPWLHSCSILMGGLSEVGCSRSSQFGIVTHLRGSIYSLSWLWPLVTISDIKVWQVTREPHCSAGSNCGLNLDHSDASFLWQLLKSGSKDHLYGD